MTIRTRFNIDTTKFFVAVLISFVAIQIASYILSELGFMPMLKMGWILFLFMVIVGITSLFVLGRKIGDLSMKKEGPFILLILLSIVGAFIFLPKYLPEIFSTYSIQISEVIRESAGTIMASIGEGIGVTSNGGL